MILFVLAMAALAAMAPSASAKSRTVPPFFFGATWDGPVSGRVTDKQRDSAFAQMAKNGAESVRMLFVWARAQPHDTPGTYDFTQTDTLVRQASAHGLAVLPVVIVAPKWARKRKNQIFSPPKHNKDYAAYLTALIDRYGPNGSFWFEHPVLKARPIRTWQIWNEPHFQIQWTIDRKHQDWARSYGKLLRSAYTAVKKADSGATVVLAGLANRSWALMDHLYKKGHIKGHFDVGAIHPYTRTAKGVITLIKRMRRTLKKHKDGKRPVWVTELGLPASKGRSHSRSKLQTTDKGMAKFLKSTYGTLASRYLSHGASTARVYWYNWASSYNRGGIFNYSGLWRFHLSDGFKPRKALSSFRSVARRYEGCAKTGSGACAR